MGVGLHVEIKHFVVSFLGRESPAKIVLVEGVRPAFMRRITSYSMGMGGSLFIREMAKGTAVETAKAMHHKYRIQEQVNRLRV